MLVYILFILISGILVFDYYFFKKNILNPCFLFILSFFLLSLFSLPFVDKWDLDLHGYTFITIFIGLVCFNLVTILFYKYYILNKKEKKNNNIICEEIVISKYIEFALIIFIFIFNIIFMYILSNKVGIRITSISDIGKIMDKYAHLIKFQNDYTKFKLPFIVTNIRVVIVGIGFWFSYIFTHNLINYKNKNYRQIIIIVLCVICSLLTGSRGEAISLIVAFFVYFLFQYTKYKCQIKKSFFIKIIVSFICLIILFTPLSKLMGRETGDSALEYISIYCGAELKNYDTFIREDNKYNAKNILESQTFMSLNNSISKTNIIKDLNYKPLTLPFRTVNNINLGNVHTIFYSFIYDFGLFGLIIFTILMGAICSFVFFNIVPYSYENKNKNIYLISYGLISFTIIFSFFSNYFYDTIISTYFIRYIIVWLICNHLFIKQK